MTETPVEHEVDEASGAASRRHTEHGLERKQQLIAAAGELFAANGYAATRIADICRQAGVAKGLFYWYFPTKLDLFAELVSTMRLQLRRTQAAAMATHADVLTRIGQGTEASVRFMAEHAAYFALLEVQRTEHEVAETLRRGSEVYLDDVRRLVVEGQDRGEIVDDDPDLLAVGVLGAVSSFSNSFRNGALDVSVDELAAFVRHWVVGALAAKGERPPS